MSKHILITGSTDGIGKLVAIKLAKNGHTIIVHGRNRDKVKATINELKATTNNKNITGYVADFSKLSDVHQLSSQLLKAHASLDVMINNAGIFKTTDTYTEEGFDIRFAVNYLAPYMLTHQVLPILEKSSHPKLINLSSAAQTRVSLNALRGTQEISQQESYAQSKLAITMWSFYLSKKYPHLTTLAVNPGSLLNTKMVQEAYGKFWSSADKGAQILYDLAVSEYDKNVTERYFDNDKGAFGQAHPDSYDEAKINALIATTNHVLEQYRNL